MLNAIRRFVADLASDASQEPLDDDDRLRLAAAAILYHVIAVDGVVSDDERDALREVLREQYGLDARGADDLFDRARAADLEAVDFYGFTSTLKQRLDDAGRRKVVELMWRMVYADGRVDEFEDNIVWRVAELLGVPARERVLLRRATRGRESAGGGDE
jgi:uncharacterized tellurite resistance protein B-like protein